MSLRTPYKIRTFQRKLYLKAKADGISCGREASFGFPRKEYSGNLSYCYQGRGTMLNGVCLEVKPVGKPDAVALHVRLMRGMGNGALRYRAHPRLYLRK